MCKELWSSPHNKNCYQSNGGSRSGHDCCPNGKIGVMSLDECKEACAATEGCDGIVHGANNDCYFRHGINLSKCADHSYWKTYVKN